MLYMLGEAIIPLPLTISITHQECSELYVCRDERRQNRSNFLKIKTSNTKRSIFLTDFGDFGYNFFLELKLRNLGLRWFMKVFSGTLRMPQKNSI